MKKRAIILEFNWYHGEVIPSLVYLFNRLDFSVDVYVSPDLLELNPFVGLSHLDFKFDADRSALLRYGVLERHSLCF